jgi:demethylphylloquinol methyltransferase
MASFRPGDPQAVQELFEQIAPRYDQLNDLLSFGLHRLWKRQAIAWLQPQPGQHLLDLCCGTGDLALVLASRLRPGGSVLGIDAAAAPLAVAARRAAAQPWLAVSWQQGDALATGLASASCDGAVIAYGLRNLADPGAGLLELRRLLRDGGRAAALLSTPVGGAHRRAVRHPRALRLPGGEPAALPHRLRAAAAGVAGGLQPSEASAPGRRPDGFAGAGGLIWVNTVPKNALWPSIYG